MIFEFFRKPLAWAIAAVVVVLGVLWLFGALTNGERAKTEAKLGRNSAEAAIESGGDAVDTVGAQGGAERATDTITMENADAIRNAEGAAAPVARPARDAGLRSLCRRAAYHQRPECLQFTPAR
ncbi:hypothetical protein ACWPMX_07705 [Tsuneonella sp. HG094]